MFGFFRKKPDPKLQALYAKGQEFGKQMTDDG